MVLFGEPMMLSRRTFLSGLMAASAYGALTSRARAHNDAGRVSPPVAPPDLSLTLDNGKHERLAKLLAGHVTAVQLVFTACRATCPIQGAVFGAAAKELEDTLPTAQLLSISIDPERDTPELLHSWITRHGESPRWRAARPKREQLNPLMDFLKARASGPDRHTAQVYFFNPKGQLALRSVDFPSFKEILRALTELAATPNAP
jgi:protein SCO1/2